MTIKLLEGKTLASEITAALKIRIDAISTKTGKPPLLAAIGVQADYASQVYLNKELAACRKNGINTELKQVSSALSREQFVAILKELSVNTEVDAILVPRPLPSSLDCRAAWEAIAPEKDIDGAAILNMGRLFVCKSWRDIKQQDFFFPCTPLAVARLIEKHSIEVSGRNVVVIGRSSIVGRPLAHILSCMDATVTVCHSRTKDIEKILSAADIVVSAVGKARWLGGNALKNGCIAIDVGTNQDDKGVFCGDMDFESVSAKASAVTPVPGGVGPVTLACLLENIVRAAEKNRRIA